MELSDVLQAGAELKEGKALGKDALPPELLKAIPIVGKQKAAEAFHKYLTDTGIPKEDLEKQRYIGKQSHLQKWYLKVV